MALARQNSDECPLSSIKINCLEICPLHGKFPYLRPMKLVAKTFAGLEEVLADELRTLGAEDVTATKRGVLFEGDKRLLYRANLECRTALRILMPIHTFRAANEADFYKKMREIDWWRFIDVRQTIAVDAIAKSEIFKHSHYIGLKTKDAIVDQFRDKMNQRPTVQVHQPDVRINIHIHQSEVSVSLDASDDSLHRRNYRQAAADAPLNEVLAAGMIKLSGWDMQSDFTDAMCGSGTLLTEAALMASNTPPQYRRANFGFKRWMDFDSALFDDIIKNQNAQIVDFTCDIFGSDLNSRALKLAEENIRAAGFSKKIKLERADFFHKNGNSPRMKQGLWQPTTEGGTLMINPPYDERLPLQDAFHFYKTIGDSLKHNWTGWTAWVFSGNLDASKHIGLKARRRIHLFNGSLECRLLKFELY